MQNQGIITCSQAAEFVWYLESDSNSDSEARQDSEEEEEESKWHRCHKIDPRCSNPCPPS